MARTSDVKYIITLTLIFGDIVVATQIFFCCERRVTFLNMLDKCIHIFLCSWIFRVGLVPFPLSVVAYRPGFDVSLCAIYHLIIYVIIMIN